MDRRLFGGDEAGAHVHAVGAERERSDEAPRISHAAGGDERDFQLIGGARQQDHVGDVVLTGMAAALEAVDADRVAADPLGLERMAHRGAFVDDLDAVRLERRHVLLGAPSRSLDDLDPAFDDRGDVFRIGRRGERRQEGEVHAERLVGHVVTARDLLGEKLRRLLRQAGDDAETAGVGHRGGEFGAPDEVHAALDDRMADAEHFGDGGLHVIPPAVAAGQILSRRS